VLCGRSYPHISLYLLNPPPPSLNYTDAKPVIDPIEDVFFNILLEVCKDIFCSCLGRVNPRRAVLVSC
jgi:hypothetical protein